MCRGSWRGARHAGRVLRSVEQPVLAAVAPVAAFVVEEPLLARDAAGVTSELSVRGYHAVTGDHDRQLVGAVRLGHGANGGRSAHGPRQLAVRHGSARLDRPEPFPYGPLERGAAQSHGGLEVVA